MIKPPDSKLLALDLLHRSTCNVQVASVIADSWGVVSWGWNSAGSTGYGEHAEAAAIRRANRKRLKGATIYVAAQRRKHGGAVMALPCKACQEIIKAAGISLIIYRNGQGEWGME